MAPRSAEGKFGPLRLTASFGFRRTTQQTEWCQNDAFGVVLTHEGFQYIAKTRRNDAAVLLYLAASRSRDRDRGRNAMERRTVTSVFSCVGSELHYMA